MTDYARMYRFGITPWERYRTAAAASITALLDREETERSRPAGPCARPGLRPRPVHPRARAERMGGGGHRQRAGRDRGGSGQEPGRGRAQLRRRRRDAATVGRPGNIRLLPRHRLLPGPGRRTASRRGRRGLCAGQPRSAHSPKRAIHPLEYLCTKWNTNSRYLDLAGDRRRAFSTVLVGNQMADSERVRTARASGISGRRSTSSERAPWGSRTVGRMRQGSW